jgi:hypothetical protein
MNGRVRFNTHDPRLHNQTPFAAFSSVPVDTQKSDYTDALQGNWENSVLSRAFFSEANIQIIQNAIRRGVYDRSSGRFNIAPQNHTNLKVIMRSIFLQNAKNHPDHITHQIEVLNNLVVDWCVPRVYSEAVAYMKYRNDISTLVVPMKRPVNVSSAGSKSAEFKHFF